MGVSVVVRSPARRFDRAVVPFRVEAPLLGGSGTASFVALGRTVVVTGHLFLQPLETGVEVLGLRPPFRRENGDAGRPVDQPHTGQPFIAVLTARTAALDVGDLDIRGGDFL